MFSVSAFICGVWEGCAGLLFVFGRDWVCLGLGGFVGIFRSICMLYKEIITIFYEIFHKKSDLQVLLILLQ